MLAMPETHWSQSLRSRVGAGGSSRAVILTFTVQENLAVIACH